MFTDFANWLHENLNMICQNPIIVIALVCIGLIFIESLFPFFPLVVFLSFNITVATMKFGKVGGFGFALMTSYIGNVLGLILIFLLIRWIKKRKRFAKRMENSKYLSRYVKLVETRSTGFILLSMSTPYSPTALINYSLALTNFTFRRYLFFILIGQFFMISSILIYSLFFDFRNPHSIFYMIISYIVVYGILIYFEFFIRKKRRRPELKKT